MLSHQSVNGSIFGKKEKEMGHTTRGLFDEHFRLEKISKQNDPLEKLRAHIDFEFYRKPLEDYFKKDIVKGENKGGRPPYDYVCP